MIRSILFILGFYLAYWISKSIFYSFLDGSTTIDFITKGEWAIAGVISVILSGPMAVQEEKGHIAGGIMMVLSIIAAFIPFSWGIVVLYNLALIGCIGTAQYED